jgi:hypothetical protein
VKVVECFDPDEGHRDQEDPGGQVLDELVGSICAFFELDVAGHDSASHPPQHEDGEERDQCPEKTVHGPAWMFSLSTHRLSGSGLDLAGRSAIRLAV